MELIVQTKRKEVQNFSPTN